jgi:glycosyltransferase involved in cell wall biosynthesis
VLWHLEGISGDPLRFEDLVARVSAKAVIALGYPDQFPFLRGFPQATPLSCYLWSQFSRPPTGGLSEAPTYIPLTEKTASHLRAAGCSRIGPVIPHGVDTGLFAPLPRPERGRLRGRRSNLRRSNPRRGSADTFVVGTVANNSRRKRLDLIVRSFALFARKRPLSRLLIKTNRPVSLDGVDLPALIAGEGVEDRVEIITAELTDPEMAELYNRMDLYLNLSEWEGFCIPVIEAMACAVTVVSPPIQGPGEILPYPDTLVPDGLIHEEGGTLLYEAHPPAAAALLEELAEDKGLRERLSREGRNAVLSRYDLRRVAAQWEGVLQRI